MNKYLKLLVRVSVAALVGLTIVTVVALIVSFNLSNIVNIIFPIPSPTPLPPDHGLAVTGFPDTNFGIYVILSAILLLLNGCAGSFIAQFLFRRWGGRFGSQAWQSFIIGIIIGFFSLNLEERVLNNKPITITVPLIYGLITALIGLLGYFLAGRKYRQRVSQ